MVTPAQGSGVIFTTDHAETYLYLMTNDHVLWYESPSGEEKRLSSINISAVFDIVRGARYCRSYSFYPTKDAEADRATLNMYRSP